MTPRSAHDQMLRERLDAAGVQPQQTVLADHESVIYELVTAGVGIGLVREELARRGQAEGLLLPFGDAVARSTLYFMHPAERGADPAIGACVAVLCGLWAQAPSAPANRSCIIAAGGWRSSAEMGTDGVSAVSNRRQALGAAGSAALAGIQHRLTACAQVSCAVSV